jgi:anti-sigma factor RsiW
MTCSECLESLLVADIRLRGSGDPSETAVSDVASMQAHLTECPRCKRAVEILREGQEGLSGSLFLDSAQRHSPESLAEYAYGRVRRERLVRWRVLPVIVVLFALAATLLGMTFGPEIKRLITPPPAVETVTFSLRCLSGEQAAGLLRPYLPLPENPMWQAERFDVRPAGGGIRAVTMRAPRATLASVPGLLARFERDRGAACSR